MTALSALALPAPTGASSVFVIFGTRSHRGCWQRCCTWSDLKPQRTLALTESSQNTSMIRAYSISAHPASCKRANARSARRMGSVLRADVAPVSIMHRGGRLHR